MGLPFVLRLRVGWGFVSTRLKERASYYEAEQRGLLFRKDNPTALRDRLIERDQVAPIIRRIDSSIAALGVALVLSLGAAEGITILEGEAGPATLKTLSGDDAIRFNNRMRADDALLKESKRAHNE